MASNSVFNPLKEQLTMLITYIEILEKRPSSEKRECVIFMREILQILEKWIEIYLNYELATKHYVSPPIFKKNKSG